MALLKDMKRNQQLSKIQWILEPPRAPSVHQDTYHDEDPTWAEGQRFEYDTQTQSGFENAIGYTKGSPP